MMELTTFFTADHRACDALWVEVEAAADAGMVDAAFSRFETFDATMRRHMDWEERGLFPAFEELTGMTSGPTMMMRAEHDQMRALLEQMRATEATRDVQMLADLGDTLLMLIQQHNAKEEQILYPMAEQTLGPMWAALRSRLEEGKP